MDIVNKARTVYNFKNTCHNCFNDIGFPRPGDFSYGELIFQTKDGQDFRIAELIDNKTFDFITTTLKSDKELKHKKEDAQKILVLIADKVNDKQFTTNYPICPICKSRIRHFGDNDRVSIRELIFATWIDFENLTLEEKFNRTKQVVASKT